MINQLSNYASAAGLAASPDTITTLTGSQDTPEAIKKAAVQFESLLIGQILKSAREADGSGWLGGDEDEAGSSLTDMAEQQVSQTLAASGGFGLAKMIASGMAKTSQGLSLAAKR